MGIDLRQMVLDHHNGKEGPFFQGDLKLSCDVARAVLDESIKIAEDWFVGNISDNKNIEDYLRTLKHELLGNED